MVDMLLVILLMIIMVSGVVVIVGIVGRGSCFGFVFLDVWCIIGLLGLYGVCW